MWSSSEQVQYEIAVKTGAVKSADTDSTVYCELIDKDGNRSGDLKLDRTLKNDFEKGNIDTFNVTSKPLQSEIHSIELWRDEGRWIKCEDDWYVEYVTVRKVKNPEITVDIFPCNRWIPAGSTKRRFTLIKYDSILPQLESLSRAEQRKRELSEKRADYEFLEKWKGVPKVHKTLPKAESFTNCYEWDIFTSEVLKLKAQAFCNLHFTSSHWDDLEDIKSIYKGDFEIPDCYDPFKSDDKWFGFQRVARVNPTMIQLCNKIPSNFAVTSEMVEPFLEGLKLKKAIEMKKIYIVDHTLLEGVQCKDGRTICAPMALFYVNKKGELTPIAIQLFKESSPTNPVFLPSDNQFTWMLVKMHFNNADSAIHEGCTHLGFTHLLVESICIAANRELSPSHPVFQLMAPHFLYLISINNLAVTNLLNKGGWIDTSMTPGVDGVIEILRRKWTGKNCSTEREGDNEKRGYHMDRDGWLPADLKARGVNDKQSLPFYPYRDDGLLVHDAIHSYVQEVLQGVYDTPEKLKEDYEVQAWARCLTSPEGAALKGVFGGGRFDKLEDLVKMVTSTIFISSAGHASANFAQYDEYGYPPNYPSILHGKIPNNKNAQINEIDVVNCLPNRKETYEIMEITKILSQKGTRSLGDFEVKYQFSPKAVTAVEKFRKRLDEISHEIKERNKERPVEYTYLDPEHIPNAISI